MAKSQRAATKRKINEVEIECYRRIVEGQRFVLMNIGARHGLDPPWSHVEDLLDIVLFEPDKEEADRLENSETCNKVIPSAVWDTSERHPFYITQNRSLCSLLEPNIPVVEGSYYHVQGYYVFELVERIKTETLDQILIANDLPGVDFLLIDAQGGEIHIFKSLESIRWRSLLGVNSEAYAARLYKDGATIADILSFLYKLGFELFDIESLDHFPIVESCGNRVDSRVLLGTRPYHGYHGRQMVYELLFLRERQWLIEKNNKGKIRKAVFIYCLHGYHDCALDLVFRAAEEDIINSTTLEELKSCIVSLYRESLSKKKKLMEAWAMFRNRVRVRTRIRPLLRGS